MDTREKLNEFAELRGWNKHKLIGWSEATDFGNWLVKNCSIHDASNSTEYTRGYRDGWRDCCQDVKEFG